MQLNTRETCLFSLFDLYHGHENSVIIYTHEYVITILLNTQLFQKVKEIASKIFGVSKLRSCQHHYGLRPDNKKTHKKIISERKKIYRPKGGRKE